MGAGQGTPGGAQVLDDAKETLINDIIERECPQAHRAAIPTGAELSRLACRQRRSSAPSWRTARTRLLQIDERVRAARRGEATAIRAMRATPGEYTATRPLEIVQIDRTLVDVVVVDEQSREPMVLAAGSLSQSTC